MLNLSGFRLQSLAHPITGSMPRWPGDPLIQITKAASVQTDGYFLQNISMGEHSGTHLNAPASFFEGAQTVDYIEPVCCPLIVADIQDIVGNRADYCFNREALDDVERQHGQITEGSFFILNTGWHKKWGQPAAFLGLSDHHDTLSFPAFGPDAMTVLIERGVIGVGIDTHGIDQPADTRYLCQKQLLSHRKMVIECLANLDHLPLKGAWIIINPLPIQGGSGSPVAPVALIPINNQSGG